MLIAIIGVIVLMSGLTNKVKNSKRPMIVVGIGLIIFGILETIQRLISN
jgi:uncharacterized membrane protein HdeD (DUF308 family)